MIKIFPFSFRIFLLLVILLSACQRETKLATEVLVIGGSTSGTAAGIQSARMGVPTIIVEETEWLGGMLTAAGVSATDGNHSLHSGIWNEFREKLRQHYGGASALATGWVSNTLFEPHTGDSIFKSMAAETKGLDIYYGYHLTDIIKEGNKVKGALFENNAGNKLIINASVTIDATDLGDGLYLAGADYDLGMESRQITGEENAPESSSSIVQDLTWVAILKDYGPGADRTIRKPENYDPELYRGACSVTSSPGVTECDKMLTYGKLPNNKYMLNWPRHGNDIYLNVVEMSREERIRELKKAKERTLGFVYFIQNELGYRNLGLADDEFPTEDRLAIIPYHREGRRLKGMVRFTIKNITDIYRGDPLYRTGISVGDYPVDHHHNCRPDAPEIHFPPVPSFNIPAGCLIPEKLDGLIVSDKAISVSNLINGSTRLQPVVLLTGQAAGVIAALSVKMGSDVRDADVREVQAALLEAGAYLMPLYDVGPDDADFKTIQRITSTGILKVRGEPYQWANRTWFDGDTTISIQEFTQGIHSFNPDVQISDSRMTLTYADLIKILSEMTGKDVSGKCDDILSGRNIKMRSTDPVNKRTIALLTDRVADPFSNRPIDIKGNY